MKTDDNRYWLIIGSYAILVFSGSKHDLSNLLPTTVNAFSEGTDMSGMHKCFHVVEGNYVYNNTLCSLCRILLLSENVGRLHC